MARDGPSGSIEVDGLSWKTTVLDEQGRVPPPSVHWSVCWQLPNEMVRPTLAPLSDERADFTVFCVERFKGMTPIGISFYLILPASDNQDRRLQGHKL